MMIDQQEGDLLANAAANVMLQFDLTPDPKTQAIIGLVMAAGTVYGPRIYIINARRNEEKTNKRKADVFNADGSHAGTTTFNTGNVPEQPGPIN